MSYIIRILTIIILTSGILYFTNNFKAITMPSTVRAFGDINVDFHVPQNTPLFSLANMAPSQIITKQVDVTNGGTIAKMIAVKGVKTSGSQGQPAIENILTIQIMDGSTVLYGSQSATGTKTLLNFFSESASSSGITLSNVNPNQTKQYTIIVGFPNTAGNEFQSKSVIFDLTFGSITTNHLVINEVYYFPDSSHGFDSLKDRAGTDSLNNININQFCGVNDLNNQVKTLTDQLNQQIAQEAKNGNFQAINLLIRTFNTNLQNILQNGNESIRTCSQSLASNDEWVELYNPTDHDISLFNYALVDNAVTTKIFSNVTIKAGGFAVLAKDYSTFTKWSIPFSTPKIALGTTIGNGLENGGDRLILKDNKGVEVDRMSWGSDTSGNGSNPLVAKGFSTGRSSTGFDTDSNSDWTSHNPTPGN